MISIRLNNIAACDQDIQDFYRSISAHASNNDVYAVVSNDEPLPENTKIVITLPNNCIVLGRDWDKYIYYALDNALPKWKNNKTGEWIHMAWEDYVIRKMGLISRPDNGIFTGLTVEILQSNDVDKAIATS